MLNGGDGLILTSFLLFKNSHLAITTHYSSPFTLHSSLFLTLLPHENRMRLRSGLVLFCFLLPFRLFSQNFVLIDSCEIITDTGYSQGCSWVDYNNDNWIDLFVTNNWTPVSNLFYKNNGDGTFTKITDQIICNEGGHSNGCSWADFNNDGYIDLCVANVNNQNEFLYRNDANFQFTKITNDPVSSDSGWTYGCTWADYDNDGFTDLYLSNYQHQQNSLFHNEQGNHFTKILNSITTIDSSYSQNSIWSDFNNDGWPDLFVANYGINSLFRNNGDGTFQKISTGSIATDDDNSFGASAADYNNDGLIDLFVANWNDKNCLYKNLGDFNFQKMIIPGLTSNTYLSEGSAWGDYDNDGDKDLFVANEGPDFLYENTGGDSFNIISNIPLCTLGTNSNGVAWGDYDGDGFLDIFVANGGNHPNQLYRNTGNSNHSITVKCIGRKSNASAIGARIIVSTEIAGNFVEQTYEVSAQSGGGYGSQNSMQTVIGLGDANQITKLTMLWPSGLRSELNNISVNRFYTLDENDAVPVEESIVPEILNNPSLEEMIISGHAKRSNEAVELRLFSVLGQHVATLNATTDLTNAYSFRLQSGTSKIEEGIYLYRLTFATYQFSGKIIVR